MARPARGSRGQPHPFRHRPRRTAASVTLRAIGPAVLIGEIGTMPARLRRPSVGSIPTMLFAPDGHTTDPSVSVPTAATARSAEARHRSGARSTRDCVEHVGHVRLTADATPTARPRIRPEVRPLGRSLPMTIATAASAPDYQRVARRRVGERQRAGGAGMPVVPMLSFTMIGSPRVARRRPRGAASAAAHRPALLG